VDKVRFAEMRRNMAVIIDGKKVSQEIKDEVKEKVAALKEKGIEVTLAVIQVGNDPASTVYVGNKKKACEYTGIRSLAYEIPEDTTEEELLKLVCSLNDREDVDGILVQLPLPPHINEDKVIQTISPEKDVDGFHPQSVGALSTGQPGFISCTPAGIIELLKRYNIQIDGRECVVIGRSNIVGKPVAMLLLRENGTVTVCHSHTADLKEVAKRADILIVAIGKAKFVTDEYIKDGAAVIDVGMDRDENGKLCGDVDFESVVSKAGAVTPVPGGVGPMTIAMLMCNCVYAAGLRRRV
jgi:5,10-methylene-tetrahydrofolate dehydrogenase/Methenyl tetrahydrofolate cyclohydrolase